MCTCSYANVLNGSDDKMSNDDVPESNSNPENKDISMSGSNTETESVELPPKKKKKVVEKVVGMK